jgi:hypothetical protein
MYRRHNCHGHWPEVSIEGTKYNNQLFQQYVTMAESKKGCDDDSYSIGSDNSGTQRQGKMMTWKC